MIIYKAENKITNQIYIGQTSLNLSDRIAKHVRTNSSYFQKAINKYGLESFLISIIDQADRKDVLGEKEKYWIKKLNSRYPNGYNLTEGGDGLVDPSEEVKQKMRKPKRDSSKMGRYKRTEEHNKRNREAHIGKPGNIPSEAGREKLRKAQTGKHLTAETKKKLSIINMGKHPTKETREKLRKARTGKHLTVETKKKISEKTKGVPKRRNARIGSRAL